MNIHSVRHLIVAFLLATTAVTTAFQVGVRPNNHVRPTVAPSNTVRHPLFMAVTTGNDKKVTPTKKKGYDPKWKKIATLADQDGPKNFADIGLKGSIPVVFRQGTENRTTVALPGQPIREVAIQAGQFIKYGCGKGECGTCECLVNGQWIRPCSTNIPPALEQGQTELTIIVKEVKNKSKSSGKFYSVRSFFMGFYNNLLGMIGFVKYRKHAKRNWQERQEYEALIKQKTLEKKRLKETSSGSSSGGLKP